MNGMRKIVMVCIFFLSVFGNKFANAAYPLTPVATKEINVEGTNTSNKNLSNALTIQESSAKVSAKRAAKAAPPIFEGKQKWVALVLAFFLGAVGAHSFYMGQRTKGYIQMGITGIGSALVSAAVSSIDYKVFGKVPATFTIGALLVGATAVWGLIDFVRILTGSLEPEEGFDS